MLNMNPIKMCNRCVMDTTDTFIRFDEEALQYGYERVGAKFDLLYRQAN